MTHIHPPPLCPDCQQPNVAPILYGLPGEDMIDAAERGDIELGGRKDEVALGKRLNSPGRGAGISATVLLRRCGAFRLVLDRLPP